uniref:Cytochrome P450 n=1 Tax=Colacogloea retinophila TaxID=1495443 RepID=Q7Z968_9BASI|nr:cytochrome P450 [Colacogloea retinophila]
MLALVCVGLFLYLLCKYRSHAIATSDRTDLAGPKGWPLMGVFKFPLPTLSVTYVVVDVTEKTLSGNLIFYATQSSTRGLEWGVRFVKTYGHAWTLSVPGLRLIDISTRPDWIEYVQKTNYHNYVKGSAFRNRLSDIIGNGIFVTDGRVWQFQRKVTSHIFTGRSFQDAICPAIAEELRSLNKLLDNYADTGETVDLQDVFYRFTFQAFGRFAFNLDLRNLEIDHKPVPFTTAFDQCQKPSLDASSTRSGAFASALPLPAVEYQTPPSCFRLCLRNDDKRAALLAKKDAKVPSDLLTMFMTARYDDSRPLSRVEIRDAIINLLLAGRDTTAQSLTWALYRLVDNPAHQRLVREEICGQLAGGTEPVTLENVKNLVQTQAAHLESLRLHPPVPRIVKQAVKDDALPNGGPLIKAGEFIRLSDWALGRNEEVWGADAKEWKPSRWIDDEGRPIQYSQWKAHFFNGGPRICLGKSLATLEGVAVIANLLHRYNIAFAPGWWENVEKTGRIAGDLEETPLYGPALTLPMKSPFWVTISRR